MKRGGAAKGRKMSWGGRERATGGGGLSSRGEGGGGVWGPCVRERVWAFLVAMQLSVKSSRVCGLFASGIGMKLWFVLFAIYWIKDRGISSKCTEIDGMGELLGVHGLFAARLRAVTL